MADTMEEQKYNTIMDTDTTEWPAEEETPTQAHEIHELLHERDALRQKCDAMQIAQATIRAQLEQHKILYQQATEDKEILSQQFSRQLAESEYARTEVQRELHTYKVQLRAAQSAYSDSAAADGIDEVTLLENQLELVKTERSVVSKQRDAFATELQNLIHKYERQLHVDHEKDSALESAQRKIQHLTSNVAHLQAQIASMASERDNVELKMLKKQFEEMNARLEKSERLKEATVNQLHHTQQAVAKENIARKERIASITTQASSAINIASAMLTTVATDSSATTTALTGTLEKVSKKRKDRQQTLQLEHATSQEIEETEERASKKEKKTHKEPIEAELIKPAKQQKHSAQAAPVVEPSSSITPAEKQTKEKSKKKKKSSDISTEDDTPMEDDTATATSTMMDDEDDAMIDIIAQKWNIKPAAVAVALTKKGLKDTSTTAASKKETAASKKSIQPLPLPTTNDLDSLLDLPIHQHIGSSRSLSEPLALTEQLALDAAVLESQLNDSTTSTSSTDSVPGTGGGAPRRKLFPGKRTQAAAAAHNMKAWDALSSSPVVIQFEEKPKIKTQLQVVSKPPLQLSNTQPTASSSSSASSLPSKIPFNPLHKPLHIPAPSKPLVGMPAAAVNPAATRNMFMSFLGGAMKAPKLAVKHS